MHTSAMNRSLLLLLVLSLTSPIVASAHVLQSSGGIGIVLHIDPEDAPVSLAPSRIYLEFKNTNGSFSLSECSCSLTVYPSSDRSLSARIPLTPSDENTAMANAVYTFPEAGVYSLRLEGAPVSGPQFSPFDLTFDIRVGEGSGDDTLGSFIQGHALHALIIGGGFLFFIGAVLYDKRKKPLTANNSPS